MVTSKKVLDNNDHKDRLYKKIDLLCHCNLSGTKHMCLVPKIEQPKKCPVGTVSFSDTYKRIQFLIKSKSVASSCALGYYKFNSYCKRYDYRYSCSSSESTPQACPPGTTNYLQNAYRTACKQCPIATYNIKPGSISDGSFFECYSCPLGHFCPTKNSAPKVCPPGTTNHWINSYRYKCLECRVGKFNTNSGGINDGPYSHCKICPLGHYCPSKEEGPIECPADTTNQYSSVILL